MIDQIKTKTEELIKLLNEQANIDKGHANIEEHDRICALIVFGHVHKDFKLEAQIGIVGDIEALQALLGDISKSRPDAGQMLHDGLCSSGSARAMEEIIDKMKRDN